MRGKSKYSNTRQAHDCILIDDHKEESDEYLEGMKEVTDEMLVKMQLKIDLHHDVSAREIYRRL